MSSDLMMNISSLTNRKHYQPPVTKVYKCELSKTLLVASNEGLDYEDLFSPQLNEMDEDLYLFLP